MKKKDEVGVDIEPDEESPVYQVSYNAPNQATNEEANASVRKRQVKTKKKKKKSRTQDKNYNKLEYSVEDNPPWYLCIFLGFQHYLIMFGATVTNPLVVAPEICIGEDDNVAKSEIIATIFFVSGITTLLQTCLGVRLPIVQGGTFTFVVPIIAIMSLETWACPYKKKASECIPPTEASPTMMSTIAESTVHVSTMNMMEDNTTMGLFEDQEPLWKPRMREIQGAIMVASLFQVLIGFSGLVGLMLRFIGPLVIAPTITLAGLSLFGAAIDFASQQWWITLVTVVLIVAFSQYSRDIELPFCAYNKRKGCYKVKCPIFRMFPVILAIVTTWLICVILTATGVFPSDPEEWGNAANTNMRMDVLRDAPWFRIPYPGQWGLPTVSVASVFGMLAGVLASLVESIGDYYACARMAQVPPPPMHAVNRGIGMEGIGCILAGAWGTGSGTTSYSENIGAIGITKVASRRVIQTGAVIMMIFGIFGKFGALFVTIPDPIIGGVFIVMFGMITAVGISNLQFVDLNSSRNLFIIGFSLFFGLTLPKYLVDNPGAIKTGNTAVDQIVTVLLSTSMFVGGLAGFVLDNTIPGTDEERGMTKWRKQLVQHQEKETTTDEEEKQGTKEDTIYEIPAWTKVLRRWKWTNYMPFLPTFDESLFKFHRCGKKKKSENQIEEEDDDEAEPIAYEETKYSTRV